MVFTENPQRLLSLDQSEEVICHCFTIEEIIYTQQKVPVKEDRSLPKGTHVAPPLQQSTQPLRTPQAAHSRTSRPQIPVLW